MPMAPRKAMAIAKPTRTLRSVAACRRSVLRTAVLSRHCCSSSNSTLMSTPTSSRNSQCAKSSVVVEPGAVERRKHEQLGADARQGRGEQARTQAAHVGGEDHREEEHQQEWPMPHPGLCQHAHQQHSGCDRHCEYVCAPARPRFHQCRVNAAAKAGKRRADETRGFPQRPVVRFPCAPAWQLTSRSVNVYIHIHEYNNLRGAGRPDASRTRRGAARRLAIGQRTRRTRPHPAVRRVTPSRHPLSRRPRGNPARRTAALLFIESGTVQRARRVDRAHPRALGGSPGSIRRRIAASQEQENTEREKRSTK